ncbi:hypothetical protein Tco_0751257 [Tanacetum coccineum]|uniref:Uncharacterized protein n=1 Tax=Tanacetum coccineum TaxID=301880 RepID=A0ABQ4Z537_9ASTR
METFRNMLQMCPKLPGQKFVDPPFEEEILTFIRELGYPGNIKLVSDVKVDTLTQPWRTFGTIINKCLSCKEDLIYQIENKESRKNTYMFYPRFTKVIINHFMSQDQSIPRRNKIDWHMANDDPILTTMRFIPQHEVVQRYGAVLPEYLTNQAIKESEAYKTYHDLATGKVQPKPKYVRQSSRSKTEQAPKPSPGKRVKAMAKVAKSGKKKKSALGLETLSEVALTKVEQLKLATKRSLIQTHSSHASGSGAHEGTGVTPGVPDVPEYGSDDEQLSWKSSDEEDDDDEANVGKDKDDDDHDDDDEHNETDNDDEDFVYPMFITHDDEARKEEVNEEDSFDLRVQTPSHVESTNDDDNDDEIQGANVAGEEMDEEATNVEGEENELYKDVNVNLEGRDVEMTDAQQTNVQTTQVLEDTYVIITPVTPKDQQQSSSVSSGFISNMLNPRLDTCIDSIFTLNTEATSLVDVPVTTIAEPPLVSATTLPPPPIPLITHMQQTPVPTQTTVPSTSLQDLPNFGSLFRFDHRLKTLETDFSEFKQTNQFAEAVSSIPGIVDAYLANKMNEAIKTVVQVQYDKLRDEAQAENEDFLNKLDDNIKKIIKNQVKEQVKAQVSKILPKIEKTVNEKLEAEVMTRSSTESKTSLAIAANLSELEPKKILIEKMESNKSIHRSNEQKNLYKALVEAYESDKLILDTYGDTVSFKRRRDDEDKDEEPFAGSNRGSKRRRAGKEPESTSTPKEKTPNNLAREEGPRESFDELMDTPLDFSAFMMNQLKVDTLTPELLVGPTFELMKGTCKSLVELEYFFEEVYKATTDQLDWNNPKGQQYPHDLQKPLPLIPNSRGRQVILFDHFINNELAYLSGGVSSRTYATSITKTKAADYGHIKWIEDLVPNTMWSEVPINYDKHALWGISHWGHKRQ